MARHIFYEAMHSSVSVTKVSHTFYGTIDSLESHIMASYILYEAINSFVSYTKVQYTCYETQVEHYDERKHW